MLFQIGGIGKIGGTPKKTPVPDHVYYYDDSQNEFFVDDAKDDNLLHEDT